MQSADTKEASEGGSDESASPKQLTEQSSSNGTGSAAEHSKLLQQQPWSETGYFDEIEENLKEPKTEWKAIVTCAVVFFFITTIVQALNVVPYLYLKKIDSTISPVYGGLILASTKSGHAVGTIAFSVYAYSTKSFKKPLLIGRALSILSLLLYIAILIFPQQSRRFVFLAAFFTQSIAEGSLILLKSFVPRVSSRQDRQAAYGIISGAMMLSILAGPGIQFGAAKLPEGQMFSWLHFSSYTSAIWIALLFCIMATVVICTMLAEPAPLEEEEHKGSFGATMVTATAQLAEMDKIAIAFVFFEKIVASICFSALLSAFSAFMETILNVKEETALHYISGSQAVVGASSIITVAVFIFTRLGKIRSSKILFFSLACYSVMYFYSYPWPPISEPIVVRTDITPYGCNVTNLRWCAEQSHVKVWYWLPFTTVLFGMAVPTAMIALDTVYSKLLGNIDQNLMQGAIVLVDDLASSIAPVVTMNIYTQYGPAVFWLVLGGNALIGFLVWMLMIPKMRKLKM